MTDIPTTTNGHRPTPPNLTPLPDQQADPTLNLNLTAPTSAPSPLDTNRDPATGPAADRTASETSYEINLDEEPPTLTAPVPVDLPGDGIVPGSVPTEGRRPIIPAGLHRGNRLASAQATAHRFGYVAAFHAVRLPWYGVQAAWWSVVGMARLINRQLRWWWVSEQYTLQQQAANDNDPAMWLKLHREGKSTRRWRGVVLALQVIALIIATLIVAGLPLWMQLLTIAALIPLLAHRGRPAGQPIIAPAVVTRRYRKLNSDVVLRAYYAAGLGHPDRADQQIEFGAQMARDGNGSKVLINLPYGRTFAEAVKAREKIASGLDVSIAQVTLSRDPASNRSHWLWVADADPLASPAGRTPLLACKETDIWQPAPLGIDERGRQVSLFMLWVSILVGAQPRRGKSFTARLLALYAALDPYVRLVL